MIEEQLEDEDCEDVHILSKIADVLHSLFATYKTAFYPYFDQIVGHFVKLLVSQFHINEKCIGILEAFEAPSKILNGYIDEKTDFLITNLRGIFA